MNEFECPACGCTEVRYAQPLGSLIHACCRACGMVYSLDASDENEDDCDDDGRFASDAEADEDAVDDDGQPDEAQEWADFDPDC